MTSSPSSGSLVEEDRFEDSLTMTSSPVFVAVTNSTSSSAGESKTAFATCAVFIGAIGSAANIIELIFNFQKQKKKRTCGYLLSINQSALDVTACIFLSLSYVLKQAKIYLSGSQVEWLCTVFYSDSVLWVGLTGSVANQVIVALLLYLEVKHFNLYKQLVRRWLICSAIALTWIDGMVVNNPFAMRNYVKDGECYSTGFWTTTAGHVTFGAWVFVLEYLLPVTVTGYCYGAILLTVRRGTIAVSPISFVNGLSENGCHAPQRSANIVSLYQAQSIKEKSVHMMMYAVFWCPCHICLFILSWSYLDIKLDETYTATLCLGCLQVSLLGPLISPIQDGRLVNQMRAVVARCHSDSP